MRSCRQPVGCGQSGKPNRLPRPATLDSQRRQVDVEGVNRGPGERTPVMLTFMSAMQVVLHPASEVAYMVQVEAHESASMALRRAAPAAARRHRERAAVLRARLLRQT